MEENTKEKEKEKFTVTFTLNDYFEELNRMEKQYGQEEELYPLINILLRGSINNPEKISIRAVAGAKNAETAPGRKLLSGGGKVFPDIAILSANACMDGEGQGDLYGCVEVKALNDELLNFENNKSGQKYIVYEKIQKRVTENGKFAYYELKRKQNEGDGKQNGVDETEYSELKKYINSYEWKEEKDFKKDGKKIPNDKTVWKEDKAYKRHNKSEEKEGVVKYRLSEPYIELKTVLWNASQLLNEIIWYKKVLYTNGVEWKYLEFESIELKDKKVKLEEFRKQYFKEPNALVQIETITIKCFTICKLEKDKESGKYKENEDNKKQWRRLKKNLSNINWIDEFENFENFEPMKKVCK